MNKIVPKFGVSSDRVDKGKIAARYRRAGAFLFVSGSSHLSKMDIDLSKNLGGIREQTASCIEEINSVLKEAGGGLENLVEVTTYLANMNDYGSYNDIYSKYFTPEGPARTTVAVHELSHPNALIAMRGTAYITEDARIKEAND